jgi:serine/threonine protein phosphatase PrpC
VWRHIAESARGDSHLADDSPCQDSSRVVVLGRGDDEALVACVADGAGSARYSAIGSATAADSIIESATAHFERYGSFANLATDDIIGWCEIARTRLADNAASRRAELRELATTLCAAIVSPSCSYFFQIGDGAIILMKNEVSGVVFWPQSGEYVNTTNFLTSNEYRDHLQFSSTTNGFSDVALLSDGMERLALRFDSRTPHRPFFEPLFQALRTNENTGDLAENLRRFLHSESVRSRSDDDKTLILASRICRQIDHAD